MLGHRAVAAGRRRAYYERFGFSAEKAAGLWLPGPYERDRFLALELDAAARSPAPSGLVSAAGAPEPKPDSGGS